jgi:hypothetical protein
MLDKLATWLAWKLPRRLVYWCAIRVGAAASTGRWSSQIVPDLTVGEALNRWTIDDRERAGDDTPRSFPMAVAAHEARDRLADIYDIITDGDAPDITDLERAALVDPLNMARRYSAILDILTGRTS